MKRKHDELTRASEEMLALFHGLAGSDEHQAQEIFRRMRGGEPPDAIWKKMR